jgi:hypothetical protein
MHNRMRQVRTRPALLPIIRCECAPSEAIPRQGLAVAPLTAPGVYCSLRRMAPRNGCTAP